MNCCITAGNFASNPSSKEERRALKDAEAGVVTEELEDCIVNVAISPWYRVRIRASVLQWRYRPCIVLWFDLSETYRKASSARRGGLLRNPGEPDGGSEYGEVKAGL